MRRPIHRSSRAFTHYRKSLRSFIPKAGSAQPVFGPLWGWGSVDWAHHDIAVNPERYALASGGHPSFSGSAWVHNPAHRGGVPYPDAATRGRFDAARVSALAASARTGASMSEAARGATGRFGAAAVHGGISAGREAAFGGGMAFRGGAGFHASSAAEGRAPFHAGPSAFQRGPGFHGAGAHNGGAPRFAVVGPHGGGPHGGGPAAAMIGPRGAPHGGGGPHGDGGPHGGGGPHEGGPGGHHG